MDEVETPRAFQGYVGLTGPECLRLPNGSPVRTPEQFRNWHLFMLASKGIARPWDADNKVRARVNHGRWIADCFYCGTGMLTRPDWGVAYCAECGACYGSVKFPKEHERITEILRVRVKREQQNWDSRQTVAELENENDLDEVLTP